MGSPIRFGITSPIGNTRSPRGSREIGIVRRERVRDRHRLSNRARETVSQQFEQSLPDTMTANADSTGDLAMQELRSEGQWPDLALRVAEMTEGGLPLPLSLRTSASTANSEKDAQALIHVADRLDSGVPIAEAVRDSGLPGSATLVGTLEAGYRSGDFFKVLEPLALSESVSQRLAQRITQSLAYPTIVVAASFVLLGTVVFIAQEAFLTFGGDMRYDTSDAVPAFALWLMLVPAAVLLFAIIEVLRARMAHRIPFEWSGPVKETVQCLRYYRLTSHLAVLLGANTPLPESLEIAGESAGGPVCEQSRELADSIRRGRSLDVMMNHFDDAPRIVRTFLGSLSLTSHLAESRGTASAEAALKSRVSAASEMLAQTVESRLDRFDQTRTIATALVLGVGVLGYTLMLFWPLAHAYMRAAQESSPLG